MAATAKETTTVSVFKSDHAALIKIGVGPRRAISALLKAWGNLDDAEKYAAIQASAGDAEHNEELQETGPGKRARGSEGGGASVHRRPSASARGR